MPLLMPPAPAEHDRGDYKTQLSRSFDVHKTIGQGTTSLVKLATRRTDGRKVALKTAMSDDPEMVEFARQEYELLRNIKHPHIIQALDFLTIDGNAVLVMDYFNGLPLDEVLQQQPCHRLQEATVRNITMAMLQTVDHLHMHGVVHRDIKPQNILLSHDLRDLKLLDFNTACSFTATGSLTPTGTRLYAAPEVVLGESPTPAADVWGVGLCAHLMLSGCLPQKRERCEYGEESLQKLAAKPVRFSASRWGHVSDACKSLLRRCLALDPMERSSPQELLRRGWLRGGQDEEALGPAAPMAAEGGIIGDVLAKCPLLPGLEPFKRKASKGLTSSSQSAESSSTGVPSPDSKSVRLISSTPTSPAYGRSCLEPGLERLEEAAGRAPAAAGGGAPCAAALAPAKLLEPGAVVQIEWPEGEARPDAGDSAVIVAVDVAEGLYKVRLPAGSAVSLAAERVRALACAEA